MATLRRLFLGVFVIAAASALLLLSDTSGSRRDAGGVSAGKRWRLDLLEFITVIDVASSQSSSIRLRTKRPVSRPKVDVAALEAAGEKLRPGKIGSAEHVRNIRKSKE